MRNSGVRFALWAGGLGLAVVLASTGTDAHKGVTSKYTYNDDVYPILRERCGQCHVDNGPTPMSLLTYNDNGGAVAWAQSIREMLIAEAMPPYYADPTGPAVKNGHGITPRELDILITWATGGTPHGNLNRKLAPPAARPDWVLGTPDATVAIPEQQIPAGTLEASVDVTVPTSFTEAKWVRAVDLKPGTPGIVRQATVALADGQPLAVWEPGDDTVAAPNGTAFKVPAGAALKVHLRYKKGWQDEQTAKTDSSSIGFYFADEPLSGKAIESFAVNPPAGEPPATFGSALTAGGRIVALRPMVDRPYATLDIQATTPTGRKVTLLKLRGIRPEWPRRYWLADPVELPKGTKIDITTKAGDAEVGPLGPPVQSPLQIALDLVTQ